MAAVEPMSDDEFAALRAAVENGRSLYKWGDGHCGAMVTLRLLARFDALQETITRHRSDRSYIIGWNDGYAFVTFPLGESAKEAIG